MRKREERPQTGFGKRLLGLREAAGLSQESLARDAGVSSTTVAKIEQGRTEPVWGTVLALAEALGVSTEDFRSKEPDPPSDTPGDGQ